MTLRFPRVGPDGHGSPPSAVLSERYDFLLPHVLRLIDFASRLRRRLPGFVFAGALPPPCRPDDGPGSGLFTLAVPTPASLPTGKSRISQVPWRSIPDFAPVHDPGDDPLRLATDGASGAAPGHLTPKASSLYRFRGYRDASSPAVYASRRASPHAMQDSLPAGGLRLCRAGVEPAGSLREVSAHLILLSRAFPGAINVPLGRGDPSSGSSSSSNRGCIRGPVTRFDLRYGRAHGGSGR